MIRRVLVINPFGLGDTLFSMTMVETLKHSLPQLRIGFLGNERTIGLLRLNPSIDVCHEFDRDRLRGLRSRNPLGYLLLLIRYFREIRRERYDTVIDLSLGREFSFAALLIGIGRRIGFQYKNRGLFLTHRIPFKGYDQELVADTQIRLLDLLGVTIRKASSRLPLRISPDELGNAVDLMRATGQTYFAVAPGGGRSWGPNATYKQWSPEKFAEAAEHEAERSGASVLLLGDREESALLEEVQKKLKAPSVIVSGAALGTVVALLSRSRFLLCNDGGLVHLANALGVKTVSIYGPVDPKAYGPYDNGTPHAVLTEPVPCRPCYQNFHFPPCQHQKICLEGLSLQKVLAALHKIS